VTPCREGSGYPAKAWIESNELVTTLSVNIPCHRIGNLILSRLLRYAQLAGISTDDLIDDDVQLKF